MKKKLTTLPLIGILFFMVAMWSFKTGYGYNWDDAIVYILPLVITIYALGEWETTFHISSIIAKSNKAMLCIFGTILFVIMTVAMKYCLHGHWERPQLYIVSATLTLMVIWAWESEMKISDAIVQWLEK